MLSFFSYNNMHYWFWFISILLLHSTPRVLPVRTLHDHSVFENKTIWKRPIPFTLTYAFLSDHMIHYLTSADVKSAFERSFSRWSAVIPVDFREINDSQFADIKIGFFEGFHGDGNPFDGKGGELAHATWPENGMLHLDRDERWSTDFKKEKSKFAVDLESVATHEIGHILGLGHSTAKKSITYESIGPRRKKVDLTIDDVVAIQALYGVNPNFNISSLDHSSSWNTLLQVRRLTVWKLLLSVLFRIIIISISL